MRRRIPRRICPNCGTEYYAWAESEGCSDCRAQSNRAELAAMVRQRRETLRQLALDHQEKMKQESQSDGIPY